MVELALKLQCLAREQGAHMTRVIALFRRPRFVVLTLTLVLAAVAPGAATAQTGPVLFAPRLAPNLAMTGPASAGQPVQLAPQTGARAQLWQLAVPPSMPTPRVQLIVNQETGLCLDIASMTSGATVIAAVCNGSGTQFWRGPQQENGSSRFVNLGSPVGNPLALSAAVGTPDVLVRTSTASDPTQEWLLQSGLVGVPGPGTPATKGQCKKGGYAQFGFKNQGRCVASVQRHSSG
jgi:Ricin-type beta-trefoil lectin domain